MNNEIKQEKPKPTFSQSQIRDGVLKSLNIKPAPQQPPPKLGKMLEFLNRKSPTTQTTSPSENKPGGV